MFHFFQGLTMGLAYVAPIGLQNLFVINTALTATKGKAWFTALVVAFFDVTLALACFFGVGGVMKRFPLLEPIILFCGSLVVIYIGIGLLRAKNQGEKAPAADRWRKIVATAFVVTWCNPQAIIDGTMMLGAFRATLNGLTQLPFITGVALASCLWFTGITLALSLFGKGISPKLLRGINITCGIVIIAYGLKLLTDFAMLLLK